VIKVASGGLTKILFFSTRREIANSPWTKWNSCCCIDQTHTPHSKQTNKCCLKVIFKKLITLFFFVMFGQCRAWKWWTITDASLRKKSTKPAAPSSSSALWAKFPGQQPTLCGVTEHVYSITIRLVVESGKHVHDATNDTHQHLYCSTVRWWRTNRLMPIGRWPITCHWQGNGRLITIDRTQTVSSHVATAYSKLFSFSL
jgi:hypothetical protein